MAAAVGVTLVTGLDYVRDAIRLRREGQAADRLGVMSRRSYLAASLQALEARGETLSTAESLTAGQVCAAIADVPGPRPCCAAGWRRTPATSRSSVLGVDPG